MNKFIAEFIVRIGKQNPRFFDYIQVVAICIGAISAGFAFIDKQNTILPGWLQWLRDSNVWISSIITVVMAQLPNQTANDSTTPKP